MNISIRSIFRNITDAMKAQPDLPLDHAIKAALLCSQKAGLTNEEGRELLELLRVEFGINYRVWASMVVQVLRTIPVELGGKLIHLS